MDLMNKTRNRQHRGQHGVGIELMMWSEERMVYQAYQKGGRGREGGLEAHLEQNPFDCIVSMLGGSTEAIKRFLEEPVFIFLESQVANWRSYYSDLIVWKGGVAERVLEVTLL